MYEYKKNEINTPIVSVIIPTFNSESTIGICIESLKKQTYARCEILIIDNNSSDGTREKVQRLGIDVLVFPSRRAEARNYGAKRSSGKYLFHIDSDMELTPSVIEECVLKCEEENVDALIIPELSVGEGYWAKCRSLEKQLITGVDGYEGVRFLRKEVFNDVAGYDKNLEAGEDYDFHFRVKESDSVISRINSHILHHEQKLSLKKIIEKNSYYSKTIENYVKKNSNQTKKQMPIPKIYLKKWRILLENSYQLPGLLILNLLGFIYFNKYSIFTKK